MIFYAFTEEQYAEIIKGLNHLPIVGLEAIEVFGKVTPIIRNPTRLSVPDTKEGEQNDGN